MAGEITYSSRRKDKIEGDSRFSVSSYSSRATSSSSTSGGTYDFTGIFVNVKDFGAVGDGVTNDYLAIMTAIDSLDTSSAMAGGGIVFFPEGTYLIRDEIEIHDAVGLTFMGVGEKTIIHADGFNGSHFKLIDCVSICVENMALVGDTMGSSLSVGGLWFDTTGSNITTGIVLKNLYINDISQYGVYLKNFKNAVLENITIENTDSIGFYLYTGRLATVTNCHISNSIATGFLLSSITQSSLVTCSVYNTTDVSFQCSNSISTTFYNCGVDTSTGAAFFIDNSSIITSISCYATNISVASIYTDTTSRFDVINFKDIDDSTNNKTSIYSFHIDSNGSGGLTLNQNGGTSFLVTNEIALGNTNAVSYIGCTARTTSGLFSGYIAAYPIDFHTTYYQGKVGLIATGEGIFICPNTASKPIDFVVGGSSVYTPAMRIIGTNYTACTIGTPTFSSGFAGSGWQLGVSGSVNTLTVDNLIVRQALTAYELDINKINSVNGGIVVSAANGTALTVSGTTIYMDEDNGSKLIQFQVNDYIRAQVWTGRGINSYIGLVTAVNHSTTYGSANIVATTISGTPWDGMELVQIGNTTDAARQNLIYITASDTNNPYIDMLAGVNAGSFTGKQKVRIGNLTGVTDSDFGGALSGYGLYADNIYLKGQIIIANPTTAGINYAGAASPGAAATAIVGQGDLATADSADWSTQVSGTGKPADNATVGATWGTNLYSIPTTLTAPSGSGLYLSSTYMGFYNGSAWKTYMDNAGNLVLGDYVGGNKGLYWDQSGGILNIRGNIYATAGNIGGWVINSGSLSKGYITLDSTNEEIIIDNTTDIVKLTKADPIYGYPSFYAESGSDFFSFLNGAILDMEYTYSGSEKQFKININAGSYVSVIIKGLTTTSSTTGLYPLYINRTTGQVYSVG